MTFDELVAETQARGFNHKDSARLGVWINQSYLEICEYERWPFLETSVTEAPPVTIDDLMAVDIVRNSETHRELYFEPRDTIAERGDPLTRGGSPRRYYIETGNTIAVWPVGTGQEITVHYWLIPALLEDDDEPLVPVRFHNLIVDGAVRRAYQDADAPERAEGVESERTLGLELMASSLLRQNDPLRSERHVKAPA